jgi:hypothetical protein
MRVEYKIIELTRAKTPSVLRAKVLEKHTANSLDRAIGRRTHSMERNWIGCEIWHEAGKSKVRAPRNLEKFLSSKNHLLDRAEEVVQCRLPALTVSFGHSFV